MCRKLLPKKTEEQKVKAEAKALMPKIVTKMHKQREAEEKLNENQRIMGKKTIVFYATNARNVKGKIVSITKIVKDCEVDFAVISELSTVNPPSIQNYTYCHALGEKKFRGTAIYVANKW